MVFEAKGAERFAEELAPFEDRKMWRLLLARLHPDAGGDHDLFAFACAIRAEMSSENHAARTTGNGGNARSTQCATGPFLRSWREAMDHWSTSNHETLKNFS